MAEIGVVHLVWVPLGLEPFERFLASYRRYPGGQAHDLILIYNGHRSPEELTAYREQLRDAPHQELIFDTPQQDIASYAAAAAALSQHYLCFVNSYTEILDAQWLHKLYACAVQPDVGVAGASGSWETYAPNMEREHENMRRRGLLGRSRGYARLYFLKAIYPGFPNPHVRTNGFLLRRDLLLQLKGTRARNKRAAYRFENSGRNMTRQIQERGLRPLLVGRDGVGYDVADWPRSNTFWQGDQANLLLADNQTRAYDNAEINEKRRIWDKAWRGLALPPSESIESIE